MEDAAQVGLDGLLTLVERHLDDITLRRDSRDGCVSCRGRAMFPLIFGAALGMLLFRLLRSIDDYQVETLCRWLPSLAAMRWQTTSMFRARLPWW